MKVSEQFIASLLARVDLVDLIGKKINLRRVGANFIGLCPFHQEKTPSFTVNQGKQFFHCFGCKKSGDAIQFIMEVDHKNFIDAVESLAGYYGLCVEKEPQQEINPLIEKIYKILNIATDFYHKELFKDHIVAKTAFNYLIERGINLSTIQHFKLGFVNAGWTNITDFLLQQSFEPALLQQAGLVLEKNGKFYDRFRLRIIFPIRNKFGKVIGFGGRALNVEQIPKYLNSPETIVFKKNQELYGLDEVKNQLKNINNLIVVEGYVDVLTLVQAGFPNVVATLGTAFNEAHLQTMFSVTSEVIFCFDGDVAGYKATIRAMELCINMMATGNMQSKYVVKFVLLPNNYDPDLLIRDKGCQEFKYCLQNAKILSDFFFEYLVKKYPEKNIESLNQLAQEAKSQIVKFQDKLLQNLWYEKLAGLLGIESDTLKQIKTSGFTKTTNNFKNKTNYNYLISNAYRALAILLINPRLLQFCDLLSDSRFSNLKLPQDVDLLIKTIELMKSLQSQRELKEVDIEYLATKLDPVYAQQLLSLGTKKIVQCIPEQGIEQEFLGAVKKINRALIEQMVDELLIVAKNRNLEDQEKLLLQQILKEL